MLSICLAEANGTQQLGKAWISRFNYEQSEAMKIHVHQSINVYLIRLQAKCKITTYINMSELVHTKITLETSVHSIRTSWLH